ncbi:MAG: tRNA (cytidine(34)-2'-O)-methyltransferase [Firmicutes bacterium]|nr:tRNA (cytidine(34)-2'-O)-methyltransferase [Bacillota bacterium]
MKIVLVEPEIPPNTGNVARTCVLTGTRLHLVEPLGFSLAEKELRRSGLDYWKFLDLKVDKDFDTFLKNRENGRLISFSTNSKNHYHRFAYSYDDYLIFGCETKGLDEIIIKATELTLRIPMLEQIPRSLNLGNSVAIVLYEALRQLNFPGMH